MSGDETLRLRALREYGVLDSPVESAYDDLTTLASLICGTPIAAISLVDQDRQWFKSIVGLSTRQTDRQIAFCNHTIRQDETMMVEDAASDSRFVSNPLVTGDPKIRFYAGTPLINAEGHALGALCVIDTRPRRLTKGEIAGLEALGRQVLALLEARRLSEKLQAITRQSVAQLLRTRALQSVSSALIEQRDIGDLQQRVVDLIADALPADRVTIFTLDADKKSILHFKKGGTGAADVVAVSFAELWDGLTGWVLRERKPALSPRSEPDPRENAEVQARRKATRCGDIIVVPIMSHERILGTITAINAFDGAEFDADHVDLMVAMANQVAMGMETSRLFSALTDKSVALKAATDRMTLATNAGGMGVWEWDLITNELRWDDQMYRVYGRQRTGETEPLSYWVATLHPQDLHRAQSATAAAMAGNGEFDEEFRILWPTGEVRHVKATAQVQRDAAGQPVRMVGVNFDITKRKTEQLQLEQDARRDKLTNLANRALFIERLTKAIGRVKQHQQACFAVLFLDFDHFKQVNDTLGHEAGDDLLRGIASRLTRALRATDTWGDDDVGNIVSRFGGDEFLILINDLKLVNDANIVATRLLTALTPPYVLQGMQVHSSASIGIATSDLCTGTAENVVRNADVAMYEAKRSGGARAVVYDGKMIKRQA